MSSAVGSGTAARFNRHSLLHSLEYCLFANFVLCFQYDGYFLLLLVRSLSQLQLGAAHILHPNRSLRFLAAVVGIFNGLVTLQHLIFGAHPRRVSFLVDFVGQDVPAGRLRLLLYDLLVGVMQLCYIVLAYDEWHSAGDTPPANSAEADDTEEVSDAEENDGLLSDEPPSRRSNDVYDRPVVRLRLRPTLRRLLSAHKPVDTPSESDRLTPRGARNRARRRRRDGGTAGREERLAEASDEERDVGVNA